jgi:nucleoside-diphosphate-sugar epimerase
MKKALVAGALGVTGRAILSHLVSLGDWEAIGLSRRSPEFSTSAKFIAIDLLNRSQVEARLSGIQDVTHIFYAALQPAANFFDEVVPNLAMLTNLVEVAERSSPRLRKVILIEGAKYYGAHLGPYKTPARETDPRHMPPNFYYNQEDYLIASSVGKSWSWTAFRPSLICGFAVGNPMNMATVIAVYATLCKEMKLPLRYPGSPVAYRALMEMCDAELLAKAMVWAAENNRCDGQAFNITNGDFNRWENLWPRLAAFFQMDIAPAPALPSHAIHVRQGTGLEGNRRPAQPPRLFLSAGCRLALRRGDLQSRIRRHVRHDQVTAFRISRVGGYRRNAPPAFRSIPADAFHPIAKITARRPRPHSFSISSTVVPGAHTLRSDSDYSSLTP